MSTLVHYIICFNGEHLSRSYYFLNIYQTNIFNCFHICSQLVNKSYRSLNTELKLYGFIASVEVD